MTVTHWKETPTVHQLGALATPKTLLVGRNYELMHRNPKAKEMMKDEW